MPKDRIYEKLLQHDRQFAQYGETLSRDEIKLLRLENILRRHSQKFEDQDKQLKGLSEKIDNLKGAVMEALDHLVVAADRVDKERLVTTYRIDGLDERVNQHDKEIAQLKSKR